MRNCFLHCSAAEAPSLSARDRAATNESEVRKRGAPDHGEAEDSQMNQKLKRRNRSLKMKRVEL